MIFYIMIFIISTLIMYILEKFDLEIKILNKNQIVHNMEEFIDIAVEYV